MVLGLEKKPGGGSLSDGVSGGPGGIGPGKRSLTEQIGPQAGDQGAEATLSPTVAAGPLTPPESHGPGAGGGITTHAEAARMPKGAKDAPYDGRQLTDASYLKNYQHLEGGESLYDNPTTPAEAGILNAVRNHQKRIDPAYLLAWQNAVGVRNHSGAMNTDTLRKLVEHHGAPAVTARAIVGGDLFRQMAPGVPGNPTIDTGAGWGGGPIGSHSKVAAGENKADAMARAAGFANYAAMHHFRDMHLLGFPIGPGQPHLAARVALADAWLSQRYPHAVGNKQACQDDLGWSTRANGAYADKPELIEQYGYRGNVAVGPHMHSAGLALDIDAQLNPYVFAGSTNNKQGDANDIMAKHLRWAAQIYGGEMVTPDGLVQWSKDMSTEELWARVNEVSKSLGKYLELAERGNDDEIVHAFMDPPPKGAGMPEAEARANVLSVKHFGKKDSGDRNWKTGRYFQDQVGRKQATGLMQHSMDMIVALRDVAGLAWGGTEMSETENGDFMHFDLRFDGAAGAAVYAFATNNNDPPAKDPDPKAPHPE
jgi:hypothetical protein